MACFVYLLRCSDGTYYCGCSNDVKKRLLAHNAGKGSRYVRARRPAELAYSEALPSRGAALRREREIKRFSRKRKEGLVAGRGAPA